MYNERQIDHDNRLRCLFIPGTGQQMYYELPPTEWNTDGTPAVAGLSENLMMAVIDCDNSIPIDRLKNIISAVWKEWYIRPRAEFVSERAWNDHRNTVRDILENKVLPPSIAQDARILNLCQKRKSKFNFHYWLHRERSVGEVGHVRGNIIGPGCMSGDTQTKMTLVHFCA